MSTIISFRNNSVLFIRDVCVQGETRFKLLVTGHVYHSERIAFRRAIVYYRRKVGISDKTIRRRRKFRIIRKRRKPIIIPPPIIPTIIKYFEYGEVKFKVAETGKIWNEYNKAVNDAIQYIKKHNG